MKRPKSLSRDDARLARAIRRVKAPIVKIIEKPTLNETLIEAARTMREPKPLTMREPKPVTLRELERKLEMLYGKKWRA